MSNTTVEQNPFPITAAQLSGNFCETLFFGMYLVTCAFCARIILITEGGMEERWRRPHEIRWMMAIIALVLFVICTFDTAIGLLHNFHAFVYSNDPERELTNIADWINITRSVNQMTAMIIGDFVLVYRCWIVYGRRWLAITPSLVLYLANLVMTAKLIEVEVNPKTDRDITLNSSQLEPWWLSFLAITAVQNTLTTGILIWRIWRVEKQGEMFMHSSGSLIHRPRYLRKVMRSIAESGAAYTTCVFVTFIVTAAHSDALYPTSDMTLITAGIAFNVILIRSSARRDRQFTMFDHKERMTALESGHTGTSGTTSGSPINLNRRSSPEEVELTHAESELRADQRSSQDDLYPTGTAVKTTVVKP